MGSRERAALGILLDQCVPGRAPPLAQLEDQRLLSTLGDRDRTRLRTLVHALRRVEQGRWGVCGTCGGAIGQERLDLLPEASTCAACARDTPGEGDGPAGG